MSVSTTADNKLDEARKALREAYDALHAIVVDDCWGADDFNGEWTARIENAFTHTQDAIKLVAATYGGCR